MAYIYDIYGIHIKLLKCSFNSMVKCSCFYIISIQKYQCHLDRNKMKAPTRNP